MSRDLAVGEKNARSADLVRRAAHAALLSFEKTPLAADLLVERFSSKDFDARDRAFLRELIYGVLRWRGRLDFVFGHFLEKPKLAPPVREALRLGTYQLLFMDRVPAHGAVDGAVSLLNRRNLGWAKGLVNAVLRKVAAHEVSPPENLEDYLTIWESHPRWLVRRWMRTLGDEEAQRRCRANNEEAPVVFRVNTRVSDTRSLAAELASEGVAARPGCVDPDCLVFLPDESAAGLRFSDTAAWREGKFIVVDESSSLVSRFAGAAVLARRSLPIGPRDTSGALHDKLAELGAGQMVATLLALEKGEVTEVPQDESLVTYAEKLRKDEAKLDWRLPASRIDRLIRGLNPWPVAQTAWPEIENGPVRIWRAWPAPGGSGGAAGEVLGPAESPEGEGIRVATGEGDLVILEIQPPGKKKMDAGAFMRGYPCRPGLVLGEGA